MLYWVGVTLFSSVFILPIRTLPANSPANSSIVGAKRRQGPHQGAQKSTSTGSLESSTSALKLASVNSLSPCAIVWLPICHLRGSSATRHRVGDQSAMCCQTGLTTSNNRLNSGGLLAP